MDVTEFIRVVALRKGNLKPIEFRLRPGEIGLSLFARVVRPAPTDVIEAVRSAGKQGDLAAAVFGAADLRNLGLVMVATTGGTLDTSVNRIHYEARLPWYRRLLFRLRGIPVHDYFNENLSEPIASLARILEREDHHE